MSTTPKANRTTRTRRDENWITSPGLFSIPSSRQKKNPATELYLIGMAEQPDLIKIGIATNVAYRLVELQTASPFTLRVLVSKSFQSKRDARRFERGLHQHFGEARTSGEWFRLSPESIQNLVTALSGQESM